MKMNGAPSEVQWSENNLEIGGRQRKEREGGRKSIKIMIIIHIPQGYGKL